MSQVTYGSLKVGDTFIYQGKEYTKTAKVRISCCKFVNSTCTSASTQKIGLKDSAMVEIKDEETA